MRDRLWNDAGSLPGRLIVVEGIDGSGKSTQLDLLRKWLQSQGYLVVFTEWNSSPIVKSTTRRGKRRHLLTPMSFSLVHAADFASRVHAQILPALRAGAIVLADRYCYTAFARDAVRGVNRDWLRDVYQFALEPTVAYYFDVPLYEAVNLITSGRAAMEYYEAGMDLHLSEDIAESFRIFQGRILNEYRSIVDEYGLVRVDATNSVVQQQRFVRDTVKPLLEGVERAPQRDLFKALQNAGLQGRYLQNPSWTGASE
jgi:dTMP kinase